MLGKKSIRDGDAFQQCHAWDPKIVNGIVGAHGVIVTKKAMEDVSEIVDEPSGPMEKEGPVLLTMDFEHKLVEDATESKYSSYQNFVESI